VASLNMDHRAAYIQISKNRLARARFCALSYFYKNVVCLMYSCINIQILGFVMDGFINWTFPVFLEKKRNYG